MSLSITIDLPDGFVHQLEETAQHQQRPMADLLRELVLQNWQSPLRLPDAVEADCAPCRASLMKHCGFWLAAR